MNFYEQLREIGLNTSEIKVYLDILENGLTTPPAIARATGIQRANTYQVLKKLVSQALIVEHRQGKRKAYAARDPHALFYNIQKQKEVIEQMLPALQGIYLNQKNKPKIIFFSGWHEVKEIFIQSLNARQIYGFGSTLRFRNLDEKFFNWYEDELSKNKIIFYDLLSFDSKEVALQTRKRLGKLYESKFLSKNFKSTPTNILVWDNHVALLTFEEPVFGTIIVNPLIYQTLQTFFEAFWQVL